MNEQTPASVKGGNMDVFTMIEEAMAGGELQLAREMLEKLLAEDPRDLQALGLLGLVFSEMEEFEAAIKTFKYFLHLDPRNTDAMEALGCLYLHMRQLDEAENLLNRAFLIDPENASIMRNLGILYNYKCENRLCAELLQNAYNLNPCDYRTIYALATIQEARGKFYEAELLLEELLNCDLPTEVREQAKQRLGHVKLELAHN